MTDGFLGAYTSHTIVPYPPYINVSIKDGKVRVLIRSAPRTDVWQGQPVMLGGTEAEIAMEPGEFMRLWDDVNHGLDKHLHA